jgi:cob(I)alamin adenosyltransferase
VTADIAARWPMQHVVLTGRSAPPGLVAMANTVSDVKVVKHAFKQGIRAQRGLEY